MGGIIIKRRPDFDCRSYGYEKLSDLMAVTSLFDLDRRVPGNEKPAKPVSPPRNGEEICSCIRPAGCRSLLPCEAGKRLPQGEPGGAGKPGLGAVTSGTFIWAARVSAYHR